MQENTLILNFLSVFTILCFFFTLFILKFSNKPLGKILLDKDFVKPQSFHSTPIPRSAGLSIITLFLIFILFYYFLFNLFLFDYLTMALSLFTLGFLDDLKIKINPYLRLLFMAIILIFCINFFSIKIQQLDISFLNLWLENTIFQNFFVLLCLLFIINGSNLIDGFNGLMGIHFLIINLVFLLISKDLFFSVILLSQIIIVFTFLLFNFPKAKIFLGDGGSYLLGTLISLNTIKIYQLTPQLSPFLFAIILFYLFYEVFFSFIRKIYLNVSPFKPDKLHLHMLLYNLVKIKAGLERSNYLTSVIINVSYLVLLVPAIYFKDDNLFCRYWFFLLIIFYTFSYYCLYKKNENI